MKGNLDNQIQQAEESLAGKLEWVSRHDTRTAFVAGISIAMLGVLATASASVIQWSLYSHIIFGLAALLLCVSLVIIYFSQYPKTESRNSSLIFFETIASLKLDDFKKRFKDRSDEEYLDDLLSQIHINSEILSRKFTYLKASLIIIAVSIIPWLHALYLVKFYLK